MVNDVSNIPGLFIALGTIIAAFIHLKYQINNLYQSKSIKKSELREERSKNISQDISSYISHIELLIKLYEVESDNGKLKDLKSFRSANKEHIKDLIIKKNNILLRLSPEDKNFSDKINIIDQYFWGETANVEEISNILKDIVTDSRKFLKNEWLSIINIMDDEEKDTIVNLQNTLNIVLIFLVLIVALLGTQVFSPAKIITESTINLTRQPTNPART